METRWAFIRGDQSNAALARKHRANRMTAAKWKARNSPLNLPMGPRVPEPRLLTAKQEAIIAAYRCRTRLSVDDCLEPLRALIPR